MLEEWIEQAEQGRELAHTEFSKEFSRMDIEFFGGVSERCKSPLAMKYDLCRNALCYPMINLEERAIMARELFGKIPQP